MKIYNTLTRKKEEFIPIEENKIKMYVCGPTVYDLIHIGNARPMIVFDTFRRYMEYKGYEVNFVSNFTDVDDKIINKAIELGVDSKEVSEKFIEECKKDMKGMNVKEATVHPKATEEIEGMVELIDDLINKGHAYEADGTVYYSTRSFKEYGKLSKKNIDDLEAGHRDEAHALKVSGAGSKRDPLDFVLWKPKKENEPFWVSPWSEGRPGWHTECSVMAKKYLGKEIDIHAGGEDLIFPHHENEIAQSEASNGCTFARYWMHNGFLKINNEKMSKSLGNFFTVRDIAKHYELEVLRFFMLSAHYRSPINFSDELMEAAKAGLYRIRNAVENVNYLYEQAKNENLTEDEKNNLYEADKFIVKFEEAMDDDVNTADAISSLFELVKYINVLVNEDSSKEFLTELKKKVHVMSDVLGITVEKEKEVLDSDIEELINQRQEARKNKDFALADKIRNDLLEMGIILEDTREGVKWKRK